MENPIMQFTLKGFTQAVGLRVFAYEGVAEDHSRSNFTVSADLALSRRYGIRLQELPLLCRMVLERYEGGKMRAFAYTEEDMRLYANAVTARQEAAKQRKPPRRPATFNNGSNNGSVWRVPAAAAKPNS